MWDPSTLPLVEATEDVYPILKFCSFHEKWAFCIFRPNGEEKKDTNVTVDSALLDALKHEITVNDVQSLSRYCQKSIQETLGDKLMLESRPDIEAEPDDHLGYELGSGLMWYLNRMWNQDVMTIEITYNDRFNFQEVVFMDAS